MTLFESKLLSMCETDQNGKPLRLYVVPPLGKLQIDVDVSTHQAVCINGRWFEPSACGEVFDRKWEQ